MMKWMFFCVVLGCFNAFSAPYEEEVFDFPFYSVMGCVKFGQGEKDYLALSPQLGATEMIEKEESDSWDDRYNDDGDSEVSFSFDSSSEGESGFLDPGPIQTVRGVSFSSSQDCVSSFSQKGESVPDDEMWKKFIALIDGDDPEKGGQNTLASDEEKGRWPKCGKQFPEVFFGNRQPVIGGVKPSEQEEVDLKSISERYLTASMQCAVKQAGVFLQEEKKEKTQRRKRTKAFGCRGGKGAEEKAVVEKFSKFIPKNKKGRRKKSVKVPNGVFLYSDLSKHKIKPYVQLLKGYEEFDELDKRLGDMRREIAKFFQQDDVRQAYKKYTSSWKSSGKTLLSKAKMIFLKNHCDNALGRTDSFYKNFCVMYERRLASYYVLIKKEKEKAQKLEIEDS